VSKAAEYFREQLRHVETALADGRKYLLGDQFTTADIILTTCLTMGDRLWRRHLRQREALPGADAEASCLRFRSRHEQSRHLNREAEARAIVIEPVHRLVDYSSKVGLRVDVGRWERANAILRILRSVGFACDRCFNPCAASSWAISDAGPQ
jgi:Glutathione S-transferase, C-terminal domain